ncbi:COG1361 S-layer family protein [Halorubrum cibi]|uniref:Uncharacterized conserved protein n=1 Tax=Halorubrum cibi TaxID=413815 RepID=A0A521D8D9_9EURY|nr:hypothetical protein [Halorubrum cibi]SMO67977.1 Uncharacterized conserved protein [Halorubrum cibi]
MTSPSGRAAVAVVVVAGALLVAAVGSFAGVAAQPAPTPEPMTSAGTASVAAGDAVDQFGQVRGEPDLEAYLPQPTVPTGGETTIEVDLLNTGEMDIGSDIDPRVTTARSLTLEAEAEDEDDPIAVTTGEVAVGDVPPGTPTSVPIELAVPDDAADGEYELDVTVRYSYTRTIVPNGSTNYDSSRSEELDVTVVVDDGARFAIVDAETDAQVGGTGEVRTTLRNVGDETARDAIVTGSASGSGVTVGANGPPDVFVGDWAPGENRTVTFDSSIAPDFAGETYVLRSSVEYRDGDGGELASPSSRVGVTPTPEQRFAVDGVDGSLAVGHSGNVTGMVENDGPLAVDDAVLVAESTSPGVTFPESRYALPDLEPGESAEFSLDAAVTPEADAGPRQFRFTVEHESGDRVATDESTARIEVGPGQSFAVDGVDSTLEVGYSGSIDGTLTNDGPRTVDEAVLVAEPQSSRVTLGESRYALPDLAPGESTGFSFDADVSGQADPGPRQVRFTVEYTGDDATLTEESTARIEVAPREPEFAIEADDPVVPAGETRRITFEITNQRPETLSSINAGLYADDPISAATDEAFVDELEPGESREIWFEVSAAGSAGVRTYPVELDFRYDDERGNDRISDVTQYPLEVTEPVDDGGGGPSIGTIVFGLLALAVLVGGAVWYRGRQ